MTLLKVAFESRVGALDTILWAIPNTSPCTPPYTVFYSLYDRINRLATFQFWVNLVEYL